jgi:para-nitrobenzyl esterase
METNRTDVTSTTRAAGMVRRGLAVAVAAIIALPAGSVLAKSKIQTGTLIHLADGDVQGQVNGQTRQFLGIPFAAPPVGSLRWRPPAPVIPWTGVLQADTFSASCAQQASLQGPRSENEDCLYLNVWSPDPAPSKSRPVMVWFHGGGNQNGSTGDPVPFPGVPGHFYDGRVLAEEHGVIVVTTNYRIGALGFLAHSELASEDPSYPYAGNQGLLDQRAALEWVQANIAAFGGNPKKVTIFGESAGSFDVCYHMVAKGSKGLFRRGISESGGCTTRQPSAAEGAAEAEAFATSVGCGGPGDQLACLRQVSPAAMIDAPNIPGPVVDGGFLTDQPRTLFDTKQFVRVPYILGSNKDEGTLFLITAPPVTTEAEYLATLHARFPAIADQIATLYPASNFPTPQDALARVVGDSGLVCGTYDSARRAAAGGAPTYLYNFAREIPIDALQAIGLHAFHGSEIVYVFGSIVPPTPVDGDIGTTMRGYWARFAKSGNPNGKGALKWPRYKDKTDQRINFDATTSVVAGFRRHECEFWWSVYDSAF